ncbi:MAG: hypothetical protein O2877_01050 [bacterium]|nr:hypothetical protein [bacterium]
MDEAKKHIVLFSHGFGVKKDDRGLFTDIAASLVDVDSVMFDYNEIDEENNTITVKPFSEQAELLKSVVKEQREKFPDAVIDLICHSQGSRIAAIARPSGIRKTIMIAPPTDSGIERTLARYLDNPEAEIDLVGVSKLPRTDGSTTFVPAAYWDERRKQDQPIDNYNKLSSVTELVLINGNQDVVLGETSFDDLGEGIKIINLEGDHDFTGEDRVVLLETINWLLNL